MARLKRPRRSCGSPPTGSGGVRLDSEPLMTNYVIGQLRPWRRGRVGIVLLNAQLLPLGIAWAPSYSGKNTTQLWRSAVQARAYACVFVRTENAPIVSSTDLKWAENFREDARVIGIQALDAMMLTSTGRSKPLCWRPRGVGL